MTSGCDNIGPGNPCFFGVIMCLILDLPVLGTCSVGVAISLISQFSVLDTSQFSVLDTIESGNMFLMSVCFVLTFVSVFEKLNYFT